MPAQIMDGTSVAQSLLDATKAAAVSFEARAGRKPCLATVLVGDDPASRTYVKMKRNRCARVGIESRSLELPGSTSTDALVAEIRRLSEDPTVDGILLQHPVPAHVDERAAFEAIVPVKDVDGVTMHSFAAMAFGEAGFHSCTPGGILRLLDAYEVDLAGAHAVVVGRSPILGKPVGMLLLRPGAVVVDAGYNAGNVGDVEFAAASSRARLITPVPGGVGPMTIAVLLAQTVQAAEASHS